MIKNIYNKEDIQMFLQDKLNVKIELFNVVEGMESQVYSYSLNDIEYIIRINASDIGFKKDDYAYKHFNSNIVPVPKVIEYGKFNKNHYYCISEKIDGITFENSSEEVVEKLLPDITNIMFAINNIDISNTKGFGIFASDTGNAPFYSWQSYLLNIINSNEYDWNLIKSYDFIDCNLIDEIITEFKNLIPFCDEVRKLRHGDFGSNNMIVDSSPKFTGVIDWDCASYGDPLVEVASAHFWSTWLMCMKKTSKYWDMIFDEIPNYAEKILCYQLHIGLEEIYENAIDKDIKSAEWLQNRCKEILVHNKKKL